MTVNRFWWRLAVVTLAAAGMTGGSVAGHQTMSVSSRAGWDTGIDAAAGGVAMQSRRVSLGFNGGFVRADRSGLDTGDVGDNSASSTAIVSESSSTVTVPFVDDFEYLDSPTLQGWAIAGGSPAAVTTVTSPHFSGDRAVHIPQGTHMSVSLANEDPFIVERIAVRFYDSMITGSNFDVLATVIMAGGACGYTNLGFYNPDTYFVTVCGVESGSPVQRSPGWHLFEWVFVGGQVSLQVDGVVVKTRGLTSERLTGFHLSVGQESGLFAYFDRVEIGRDPDTDGDGVRDSIDNCPAAANPDQADADGDRLGNACDADADGDEVVDSLDNCVGTPNPDQANVDGDREGDACDGDDDNDAVLDDTDLCAATPMTQPVDAQGCAVLGLKASSRLQIGTAVRKYLFLAGSDTNYNTIIGREFGLITPENELKMPHLWPEEELPHEFADAELILDAAEARTLVVRGHTLIWHRADNDADARCRIATPEKRLEHCAEIPQWLLRKRPATGFSDPFEDKKTVKDRQKTAKAALEDHIDRTIAQLGHRITYWDVVNEALVDSPGQALLHAGWLRDNVWRWALGKDYVREAFKHADAARKRIGASGMKLFYNEYVNEDFEEHDAIENKATALLHLLRNLRSGPIDGVGLQMHANLGKLHVHASTAGRGLVEYIETDFRDQLEAYLLKLSAIRRDPSTGEGLEIHITELDVENPPAPLSVHEGEAAAAAYAVYRAVGSACADVPECKVLSVWGFTTPHTWLFPNYGFDPTRDPFPGERVPYLLFDYYRPTPMHEALRRGISGQ